MNETNEQQIINVLRRSKHRLADSSRGRIEANLRSAVLDESLSEGVTTPVISRIPDTDRTNLLDLFKMSKMTKIGLIALSCVVLLIGGGFVTASAANAAIPGDTMYGIDRMAEDVQRVFLFSDQSKAEFELDVLDERAEELDQLEEEDADSGLVADALEDLDEQRDETKECIRDMEDNENSDEGEMERIRNRYEEHVEEQYKNMEQIQEKLQNEGEESEIKTVNKVMENYKKDVEEKGNGDGNGNEDSGSDNGNQNQGSESNGSQNGTGR